MDGDIAGLAHAWHALLVQSVRAPGANCTGLDRAKAYMVCTLACSSTDFGYKRSKGTCLFICGMLSNTFPTEITDVSTL